MGSRFTEFVYGFSVYRVVVWVLGLQSCCMGSLFTELLYGFSVDRVVVWVLGLQSCCMGSRFTVIKRSVLGIKTEPSKTWLDFSHTLSTKFVP